MWRSGRRNGKSLLPPSHSDDVGLVPGRGGDGGVIDAGEHDAAGGDVGLVFLALLDGAIGGVEIGAGGEALHPLAQQIAIGHGMADHGHRAAAGAEMAREMARGLRLAAAGAHRRHGDHRPGEGDHGARRPGRMKSAPAARAREAWCITSAWVTSL